MWIKQLAEFLDVGKSLVPFQDTKTPDMEHSTTYLAAKRC